MNFIFHQAVVIAKKNLKISIRGKDWIKELYVPLLCSMIVILGINFVNKF